MTNSYMLNITCQHFNKHFTYTNSFILYNPTKIYYLPSILQIGKLRHRASKGHNWDVTPDS